MLLFESCVLLLGTVFILVAGQGGGFTNPVEPTVIEDFPTTSNAFNFETLSPSVEGSSSREGSSSSSPSAAVSWDAGSDMLTLTGERSTTASSDHSSTDGNGGITGASSSTAEDASTTEESQTTTTTRSEDVAPALRPSSAVAMIAAIVLAIAR